MQLLVMSFGLNSWIWSFCCSIYYLLPLKFLWIHTLAVDTYIHPAQDNHGAVSVSADGQHGDCSPSDWFVPPRLGVLASQLVLKWTVNMYLSAHGVIVCKVSTYLSAVWIVVGSCLKLPLDSCGQMIATPAQPDLSCDPYKQVLNI